MGNEHGRRIKMGTKKVPAFGNDNQYSRDFFFGLANKVPAYKNIYELGISGKLTESDLYKLGGVK